MYLCEVCLKIIIYKADLVVLQRTQFFIYSEDLKHSFKKK